MDILARRKLLQTDKGPGGLSEYITSLEGRVKNENDARQITVLLRYVPTIHVLAPDSYVTYLETLGQLDWTSVEDLAVAIRDDAMDVLLARWVQVILTAENPKGSVLERHKVVLEERQPRWDNKALLGRLELY